MPDLHHLRRIAEREFPDLMHSTAIYRHDNMPHPRWQKVATFPQHFHDGAQHTVGESDLPSDPEAAVRAFLEFARSLLEETEDG